jgi:O-glycosyl hydrolase
MLDLKARRQVMDGFGVSERVWTDPHLADSPRVDVPSDARRAILRALFGDLGLTRLRSVLDPGIEPVNDNKFDFSGKRSDDHIALVKEAIPLGLRTFFASPVHLEPWMGERDVDEYVAWAMAILSHWRSLGVEPTLFSPVNEPGLRAGGNRSAIWLTKVVKSLGARMRSAGLRTRLLIPDDLNASEAYTRAAAVLDDPEARPYVGALGYHLYGGNSEDRRRLGELGARFGIPVWMTEFSSEQYRSWPGVMEWATVMHHAITEDGASAVDYLWGFFGDQQRPHTLIAIDFEGGRYVRYSLEPVYYVMGQFSRFVRPGAVRVETTSSGTVLASAYTGPGRDVVVLAINTRPVRQRVTVSIRGGRLARAISATRTSRTEQGVRLSPIAGAGVGFTAVLAGTSVTTFVARSVG